MNQLIKSNSDRHSNYSPMIVFHICSRFRCPSFWSFLYVSLCTSPLYFVSCRIAHKSVCFKKKRICWIFSLIVSTSYISLSQWFDILMSSYSKSQKQDCTDLELRNTCTMRDIYLFNCGLEWKYSGDHNRWQGRYLNDLQVVNGSAIPAMRWPYLG